MAVKAPSLNSFRTIALADDDEVAWADIDTTTEARALALLPDGSVAEIGWLVEMNQLWCELPLGPKWTAAFRIAPATDGAPTIGELRIFPTDATRPRDSMQGLWKAAVLGTKARCPRFGINSQVLKQLRWGDVLPLVRDALTAVEGLRQQNPGVAHSISKDVLEPFVIPHDEPPAPRTQSNRGRPRVLTEAHYARVAAAMEQAKQEGHPNPAAVVAKRLGLRSAAYVRVLVQRAKNKGYATRGRVWTMTEEGRKLAGQRLPRIATNSETGGSKRAEVKAKPNKNARKSPRGKIRA